MDPHLTNVGYLNMLQGMFNSLVRYPGGDMGNVEGIEPDLEFEVHRSVEVEKFSSLPKPFSWLDANACGDGKVRQRGRFL